MVKDQSHEEYQNLLKEIQDKRAEKLDVAQGRHALMETHFRNGYLAQRKAAFDKFHVSGSMVIHDMCERQGHKQTNFFCIVRQVGTSTKDDESSTAENQQDRTGILLFPAKQQERIGRSTFARMGST
jgi:hypothetical protein